MINIVDTYEDMHAAAHKAKAAMARYSEIEAVAKADAKAQLRSKLPHQRTSKTERLLFDDTKKNNLELQDAISDYKFWRDEQVRLSSLLQGEAAFSELCSHMPSHIKNA